MQGSISKTFLYHSSVTWKTPPHFWCHFWHLGNISFCSQLLCYIWLEKKMYWTFLMFHWDWGTDPQNKLEGEGMTFSQKKVLKGKKKGRGWLFPKNNSWKEIVPKKYLQAVMPKKNCAMEEKNIKLFTHATSGLKIPMVRPKARVDSLYSIRVQQLHLFV